jgi:hypothetical protein
MATSGSTAFNMPFTDIAEEAWERAGRELRSGMISRLPVVL